MESIWSLLIAHFLAQGHTFDSLSALTRLKRSSLHRWSRGTCPSPELAACFMRFAVTHAFIRQNSPDGQWSYPDEAEVPHRFRVLAWLRLPQGRQNGAWIMAYELDGEVVEVDRGPWRPVLTLDMLLDELSDASFVRAGRLLEEIDAMDAA